MAMGKYVVFDGMDGSGKGTQIALLRKLSPWVLFTREPGGTEFAEDIRKLVRDNPLAGKSTALNNFLLFWAAREELQQNLIAPALKMGKHVFSDRGDSSTFAFQLCGEEHYEKFLELFAQLRNAVFAENRGRHKPDLYIVFDLPAEVARERALQDASRMQTHFDIRDIGYYQRVRDGFRRFANWGPVEFVDATQSPKKVHRSVAMILATRMIIPEYTFVID